MASTPKPIVYVVDGDLSVRESLELLIRAAGWQPEVFASALEFLSQPHPAVPSFLVLDVELPDLSGLELQERIADVRRGIPMIFLGAMKSVKAHRGSVMRMMKANSFADLVNMAARLRPRRSLAMNAA